MRRGIIRIAIVLACAVGVAMGAETLAEVEARTDMNDADSVFALAQWCQKNNMPAKANHYYVVVIHLDPNHEGARTAMHMVRVGDRWVPASAVKAAAGPAAGGEGGDASPAAERAPIGKGPSAAEIAWDLTPPKDPAGDEFIQKYIDALPSLPNDDRRMDDTIETMVMPEHLPSAIPRLCQALLQPSFNDLYGAALLAQRLYKDKQGNLAKPLLGFMAVASAHVTDPDDLEAFAYTVPLFHDRRVVPRLIELMAHPKASVASAAADAVAQITGLPPQQMTVAKAQDWWDRNHAIPEQQIFAQQLASNDPLVALQAAQVLYDFRDRAIVPVLIKLLKTDDRNLDTRAIDLIRRITGNDWNYDPESPIDQRKKSAEAIEKWWKDEQFRFVWMEDRDRAATGAAATTAAAAVDPCVELVHRLGSIEGNQAQDAEAGLLGQGEKAVPALIAALDDASPLVRRKASELLRSITKQDIAFDPRGSDDERRHAVEAWKTWARGRGLLGGEPAPDDKAGAAAPDDAGASPAGSTPAPAGAGKPKGNDLGSL